MQKCLVNFENSAMKTSKNDLYVFKGQLQFKRRSLQRTVPCTNHKPILNWTSLTIFRHVLHVSVNCIWHGQSRYIQTTLGEKTSVWLDTSQQWQIQPCIFAHRHSFSFILLSKHGHDKINSSHHSPADKQWGNYGIQEAMENFVFPDGNKTELIKM